LGFGLYGSHEDMVTDHNQVPLLGRPEETRQFNGLLAGNELPRNPRIGDEVREQIDESVHVRAAGHRAAQPLVGRPAPLLLVSLRGPGPPVHRDSISNAVLHVGQFGVLSHARYLTRYLAEFPDGSIPFDTNALQTV
jgi:hypothetical protein